MLDDSDIYVPDHLYYALDHIKIILEHYKVPMHVNVDVQEIKRLIEHCLSEYN